MTFSPQRAVLALGVLSALTSISLVFMSFTRGDSATERELQELRAVTHTLHGQLKTAQLALANEKVQAGKEQQQQQQQQPQPQEKLGLRRQERQLQEELDQLERRHKDLANPTQGWVTEHHEDGWVSLRAAAAAPPLPPEPEPQAPEGLPFVHQAHAAPPDDDAPWPPVTAALAAARRAAGRHPTYRLAMVVPWLGEQFPPWFEHFLESCRRSDYLVDWLIFHQNAQLPASPPANVVFVNLGAHGLGIQFGASIARATNQTHNTYALVKMFQLAFQNFAYIVTEYKPTLGVVFAEYLATYSHWSYTDIDLMVGDLPNFLDRAELRDFDIVTYSFGDYERLYMRGQFAAHRNTRKVSSLWMSCDFLNEGLLHELQVKHAQVERAKEAGQQNTRPRFNSAEGCYSAAVTSHPELRIKYATKVLADFTAEKEIFLSRGAARMCAKLRPNHTTTRPWDEDYEQQPRRAAADDGGGRACDPFVAPIQQHVEELPGNQRADGPLIPVALHSNCSRWVDEKYRICADCSEGWGDDWNLFYLNGSWYRQHFVDTHPPGVHEGAFFHFQVWKAAYKRLRYGGHGMERVRPGASFKLMAHGIFPLEPDDASR